MSSGKSLARKTGVKLPGRLAQGLDDAKETRSSTALPQPNSIIAPFPSSREPRSSEQDPELPEGTSSRGRPWLFDKKRLVYPKQLLSPTFSGGLSAKTGKREGKLNAEDPASKRRKKDEKCSLDSAAKPTSSSKVDSSVGSLLRQEEKATLPTSSAVLEAGRIGDEGVPEVTVHPADLPISVSWIPGEDCIIKGRELIASLPRERKASPLSSKASPLVFADELLDTKRCLDRVARLYDRELRISRARVAELEASVVEGTAEKLEAATLRLKEVEAELGELSSRFATMRDRCQKLEGLVVTMKGERDALDVSLKRTITRLRGERCQDLADLERATAEVSCYRAVLTKVEAYLAGRLARKEAEAAMNWTLGALSCLEVLRGGRNAEEYKSELLAIKGEQEKLVLNAPSLEQSDLIVTVNDVDDMLKAEIARDVSTDVTKPGEE